MEAVPGIECPMQNEEAAGFLFDYCARRLGPEESAVLEDHLAVCESCRDLARAQRALWDGLDCWEAAEVSPDFDRRLCARINAGGGWSLLRTGISSRSMPEMPD